jgi:hypothetical protein
LALPRLDDIRQFTVLAVHFFAIDEINLQQSEKIVVYFYIYTVFFCLHEDESSYTYKNVLYDTARMKIVVYAYGFVLVFARRWWRTARLGGGGFVLGNYENNSIKHRRAECERISGLVDHILEAAVMLEDGEKGGSSSLLSSLMAVVDHCRQTATRDKDNQ